LATPTSDEDLVRRLDRATDVYESGDLLRAARIIWIERSDAQLRGDVGAVAQIDQVAESMRSHLEGNALDDFNSIVESGSVVSTASLLPLYLDGDSSFQKASGPLAVIASIGAGIYLLLSLWSSGPTTWFDVIGHGIGVYFIAKGLWMARSLQLQLDSRSLHVETNDLLARLADDAASADDADGLEPEVSR
jgi:hypothetical protein